MKRSATGGSIPPHPTSIPELRARLNATFLPNNGGGRVCIEYQDEKEPDSLGRRHFALLWIQDDGHPYARVRGQHFFAVPSAYVVEDKAVAS